MCQTNGFGFAARGVIADDRARYGNPVRVEVRGEDGKPINPYSPY